MRERETVLPYAEIPVPKCRRNEVNIQSPLEHHGDNRRSKVHQWMLKLVGESLRRNRIFA